MPNKTKHYKSKHSLLIAIIAVSILLMVLIVLTVNLLKNDHSGDDGTAIQSTQPTGTADPLSPSQPASNVDPLPTGDPQTPADNVPTESAPMVLDQGLYIVHMGNFSGRYVENGSDVQLENFCAVIVENRSEKTLQLLQFKIIDGERTYEFRLTTLPPGERAVVQELNQASFIPGEAIMTAKLELCVFFNEEPSLHEDVFAVSGTENGIELRNRTDKAIEGPIYVYYKTRSAEGYGGGITYRISIPGLDANGVYNASVNHFWPGSSQVMFIEYAQ